ncbi:inositol monophosphatase 1-like [Neolamprologus brichardi]|uniref:inositol monophosphatase 1-like n=1 Tax=Neolamprologus brichardi TaxID=32507 RepID=UPI001643C7CE|nr:inositol monophosphatase 1-like [Neolamprologus brichardi]
MADWTDCLNFGISIAKQASKVVLTAFQQEKEVKLKSSPADLVTETDQRVEMILLSAIRSQYPQHRFYVRPTFNPCGLHTQSFPKRCEGHMTSDLLAHIVRALGTAAVDMCQVATGGADAYYHIGMHCWDIAASAIIVREAGGVVRDTDGSEFDMMSRRVIAASSAAVASRIAQVIRPFPCSRDDDDQHRCVCGATGVNRL